MNYWAAQAWVAGCALWRWLFLIGERFHCLIAQVSYWFSWTRCCGVSEQQSLDWSKTPTLKFCCNSLSFSQSEGSANWEDLCATMSELMIMRNKCFYMQFGLILIRFRKHDDVADQISHYNSEYRFQYQLRTLNQIFPFASVWLVIQYKGICVFGKLCSFHRHFVSILQVTDCKLS